MKDDRLCSDCVWGFDRFRRSATLLALLIAAVFFGQAAWAQSVPIISTVAGGGTPSSGNGDGGSATQASLYYPVDVAVDASGNLYIADTSAFRVRKVTAAGIITTAAGNGSQLYNGDGIPAQSAAIDVRAVAVDAAGNLYIADLVNRRVRKVAPNGIITTVAGNGLDGYAGDGGPATAAKIYPTRLGISPSGELHIVGAGRIRKVGNDGIIRAVAGTGEWGFSGDGGPATSAMLANPEGIAFDKAGNLYIADYGNDRIRRVTPAGTITTVAGGGHFRSDPVALNMQLLHPHGVAVDARGNLYIAEMNNLIRVVNAKGIIEVAVGQFNDTTFGNEGAPPGFSGDGGPAIDAMIYEPVGIVLDKQENVFFADSRNSRIRKVTKVPTPRTPVGINAFHPYQTHMVGSFTQHVAVADVTGDGREDALLTTATWGGPYAEPENDFKLLLFVQRPDGSLAPPLKYGYYGDAAEGRYGGGLATTDLNRDGFADVIVGTLRGITVYLGKATGLAAGVSYTGVTGAEVTQYIVSMDVNRDGKLDVVTYSGGRSEGGTSPTDRAGLIVFYGNGAGSISGKQFTEQAPDSYGFRGMRAGDVNRDGLLDLTSVWADAIGGYRGGASYALNNGAGAFLPATRMQPAGTDTWADAYAMGDFNGDGRQDFIVSRDGNAPIAKYWYFTQNANGTFTEAHAWRAFDGPADMLGTDMNGDGLDDFIVLHAGWSSIGYHQQTRDGLDVEVKYYTRQSGNPDTPALAVGDLNGDGCKDIAMADYNYGLIVLYGKACIWAMNGSQPRVPPTHSGSSGATSSIAPASRQESGHTATGAAETIEAPDLRSESSAIATGLRLLRVLFDFWIDQIARLASIHWMVAALSWINPLILAIVLAV